MEHSSAKSFLSGLTVDVRATGVLHDGFSLPVQFEPPSRLRSLDCVDLDIEWIETWSRNVAPCEQANEGAVSSKPGRRRGMRWGFWWSPVAPFIQHAPGCCLLLGAHETENGRSTVSFRLFFKTLRVSGKVGSKRCMLGVSFRFAASLKLSLHMETAALGGGRQGRSTLSAVMVSSTSKECPEV